MPTIKLQHQQAKENNQNKNKRKRNIFFNGRLGRQLLTPAMRKCQLLKAELKVIKVGTLNVQGCRKEDKQQFIYEDALKYDQQIIGHTESHVVQEDILTITARHQTK